MTRRLVVVLAGVSAMALAMPAAAMSPTQTDVLIDGTYDPMEYVVAYTLSITGMDEQKEEIEVDVEGPQGQVNHGTIVSAVVASLKEQGYTGIGCVVRHFAQTDWGMGDQQVKVGEEMEDGEGTEDTTETPAQGEESVEKYLLEVTTYCAGPGWGGDERDLDEESGLESEDDDGSGPPPWATSKKDKDQGDEFVPPGQRKKAGRPDRP